MTRVGTLLILDYMIKGQGPFFRLCLWNIVGTIQATVFKHFQYVSYWWWEERPYSDCVIGWNVAVNFGSPCEGMPHFALSSWSWVTGWLVEWVRGFVTLYLWTWQRLQFLRNHFQTSLVICGWWEEEPYWFWVLGSKHKVNFGTLCIRPCGHDTDFSFCRITFKLHM